MKDATEDVKGWKKMKEDREKLEIRQRELQNQTRKRAKEKKRTKGYQERAKNKRGVLKCSIIKMKIGGSREIRSNVVREKRN